MANLRAPAALAASLIISGFLFLLVPLTSAMAEETGGTEVTVWERFAAYDPDSDVVINHSPLAEMLIDSVFPLGKSRGRQGSKGKKTPATGTRIVSTTSSKPSRLEGNRLMIHAFTDDHEAFYAAYQEGLERLSRRRPLSTLNHDEQLAFWLNLYNVIVINKIIDEYPISKTKGLKLGSKRSSSFWSQQVTTIEGVPLSLNDIEQILYHNWDSPLVIYGLWQGSIGGPTLLRVAFTGKNVWKQLDKSAEEFVNSNRGTKPKGTRLDVSLIYEWGKQAFDNSDQKVIDHIQSFAISSFMGDISDVTTVRYKLYDWQTADLLGGKLHTGYKSNYAAFLANYNTTQDSGGEMQFGSIDITGWLTRETSKEFSLEDLFPPQAFELITEAYRQNGIPLRTPLITTIECAPDESCEDVE